MEFRCWSDKIYPRWGQIDLIQSVFFHTFQSKVSQHWLIYLLCIFIVPRRWLIVILQLVNIPLVPPSGQNFTLLNNHENRWQWFLIKFAVEIHGVKRINPNDFGDSLTFPLAPPSWEYYSKYTNDQAPIGRLLGNLLIIFFTPQSINIFLLDTYLKQKKIPLFYKNDDSIWKFVMKVKVHIYAPQKMNLLHFWY